ncbi:MAG: DNA recombination protein RmuC [Desulfobulbaceae bacterium]|nr:DNA recombination protein RmuC [Desulfobulbaceae bacterium]MCF6290842.1 DNA recombination protein RmuC [Desulfobacterales bacterium]
MNSLILLAERLHGPSLVLGLFCAGIPMLFFGLILYTRLSRRNIGLSIRLEQAGRNISRLDTDIDRLRAERDGLRVQNRREAELSAALEAELVSARKLMQERESLLETTRKQMERDFQLLAGQTLSEKGAQLNAQHESGLQAILEPMREQLQAFRQRVEDVYDKESRDHSALRREIELLRDLNQQLSTDAIHLTEALQGKSKIQGQWGEMILEKLLEDSGLRKGTEFETQAAIHNEQGQLRQPDIVIHLPKNRDIVIDAKVSLKSWALAAHELDPKKQQKLLKQHLHSLHSHIKGLAGKQYHQLPGLNSLDFVLLFMPVEGAFQAALIQEPELLTQAMRKKVILAGPSTLLAILRTIHHLWRIDEQGRNGLTIAKQAGNLYDKFVGFAEAFEEIGFRLEQSRNSWQTARKRLVSGRGNLIARVEALKELGIQPERNFPKTLKDDK